MPKRIPLGAIGVTRDGKTVYPTVGTDKSGEPFDFTDAELKEIAALEKAGGVPLVRKLIVEDAGSTDTTQAPGGNNEVKLSLANSKGELQAAAAERGVEFADADSKQVLLDKITAHDAANAAESEEDL